MESIESLKFLNSDEQVPDAFTFTEEFVRKFSLYFQYFALRRNLLSARVRPTLVTPNSFWRGRSAINCLPSFVTTELGSLMRMRLCSRRLGERVGFGCCYSFCCGHSLNQSCWHSHWNLNPFILGTCVTHG